MEQRIQIVEARPRSGAGPQLREVRVGLSEQDTRAAGLELAEAIPAVVAPEQRSAPCDRRANALTGPHSRLDAPLGRNVCATSHASPSGSGYVVFLRGAEGWRRQGTRIAQGSGGGLWQMADVQVGPVRYTLVYDGATNVLDVNGARVNLNEGNVVLVDRIDGVGGPPIVRRVGCVPLDGRDAAERAIETIPEVARFVGRNL